MSAATLEAAVVPTTINVGDLVTSSLGVYVYGGKHENPNFTSISYDLRYGGATLKAASENVAPAALVLNLKDSRIDVRKAADERPGTWVGIWRTAAEGVDYVAWNRTKKEAVFEAATRLAIKDWHEQGGIVND